MKYRVQISEKAESELAGLPEKFQKQILGKLRLLAENPRHNAEKLKGHPGWRIRSGDYRILYEIQDASKCVVVFAIDNRKDVYKRL